MAEEEDPCPLHECVFTGNVRKLSALIRTHDVAKKDKHGNSSLFLFSKFAFDYRYFF